MNDRQRAFHEAGHAVMILALKCSTLNRVSIKTASRGGRISWGFTDHTWHVLKPLLYENEAEMVDRFEHNQLMFAVAGDVAEKLFLLPGERESPNRDGFITCDESDIKEILYYGSLIQDPIGEELIDYRIAETRAMAMDLLEHLSEKVEAIASALLEKRVLTGKEVKDIYFKY